jgi:hypothetical protein
MILLTQHIQPGQVGADWLTALGPAHLTFIRAVIAQLGALHLQVELSCRRQDGWCYLAPLSAYILPDRTPLFCYLLKRDYPVKGEKLDNEWVITSRRGSLFLLFNLPKITLFACFTTSHFSEGPLRQVI